MNNREKLIELLQNWGNKENDGVRAESIADYLLENGVIVPPVKVGGIAWIIYNKCVTPSNVMAVYVDKSGGMFDLKILTEGLKSIINKDYTFDMVYTTKEEAEKALKGGAANENISNS